MLSVTAIVDLTYSPVVMNAGNATSVTAELGTEVGKCLVPASKNCRIPTLDRYDQDEMGTDLWGLQCST